MVFKKYFIFHWPSSLRWYSSLTLSFEGNPLIQRQKILSRKTRDLEAARGEDFLILACTVLIHSGVFRGATVRYPPFGPIMKIFYRRLYTKRCVFAIFQQELQNSTMFDGHLRFRISEKWANLRFPLNIQKQKVCQLRGGFAPWPPDQGLWPWTPLGAPPRPPL